MTTRRNEPSPFRPTSRRPIRFAALALVAALSHGGIGMAQAVSPSPVLIRVDPRPDTRHRGPLRSVDTIEAALDRVARLRGLWPGRPIVIDLAPGLHRL